LLAQEVVDFTLVFAKNGRLTAGDWRESGAANADGNADGSMNSLNSLTCVVLLTGSLLSSQTARETKSYLKQAEVSETAGKIQIVANSPRPLAQILDSLREKYGWAVSYEDPQFISELDLVDAQDSTNHARKTNLPRGGVFSVEFPSAAEEEATLQLVVDLYNRSKNPGRFELRKSEQRNFSVVGVEARDRHGQMSRRRVVFDVPITLAIRPRTASDTVRVICRQVVAQRGVPVTVGVSPRNVLDQTVLTVGGANISARDLLLRTLAATRRPIYWRLLFDPNSKGYFLDIHLTPTS
jgi:hypothetical protein